MNSPWVWFWLLFSMAVASVGALGGITVWAWGRTREQVTLHNIDATEKSLTVTNDLGIDNHLTVQNLTAADIQTQALTVTTPTLLEEFVSQGARITISTESCPDYFQPIHWVQQTLSTAIDSAAAAQGVFVIPDTAQWTVVGPSYPRKDIVYRTTSSWNVFSNALDVGQWAFSVEACLQGIGNGPITLTIALLDDKQTVLSTLSITQQSSATGTLTLTTQALCTVDEGQLGLHFSGTTASPVTFRRCQVFMMKIS